MKTKTFNNTFTGILCAGAVLLMASSASAQNIYVVNWFDPGEIYDFTSGGSQSTFYSDNLDECEELAFDSSGNLFVADSTFNAVYEITPSGTLSTFGQVDNPNGLAFNSAGDLYVSSFDNGDIYEFTPSGSETTFTTGLITPTGMAFDSAGDLFVAAWSSGEIYEFKNNGGTLNTNGILFGSGLAKPAGIAFNGAGDLFVADNTVGNGDVAEFTPNGTKTIFATGMNTPNGVAFDRSGNLFVANSDNLTKISPSGSETTFASGLGNATGLAIQGETLPGSKPATAGKTGILWKIWKSIF